MQQELSLLLSAIRTEESEVKTVYIVAITLGIISVIAEPCIYAYECYTAHKKRNLQ